MPSKGMRSICFNPRTHSFTSPAAAPSPDLADIPSVIEAASLMIMKWNPDTSTYARVTSLFYESKLEAVRFIDCTNDLHKAMQRLISLDPASEYLSHAHFLIEIAMKRLQKEFYQILSVNRAQLDPESVSTRSNSLASLRSSTSELSSEEDETSSSSPQDEAPDSIVQVEEASLLAMNNLKAIADCMISSGYAKECIAVYRIIRKSIVDEGIYRLGVEKASASHFGRMDWEVMELRIRRWLEAIKVSMRTLFLGERILCDHVFANSDSVCGSLFGDIVLEGAAVLFGFPEMVAKNKKASSPEKIFRVLDMYSAIAESWQDIVSTFSYDSTSAVRTQAVNSLIRLGELVRAMLSGFEGTLQKDSSKSPVNGGGVHSLTVHTMNYLTLLGDYSSILADIFPDSTSSPARSSLPASFFGSADPDGALTPAISMHLAWLILVLLCKLDLKAKHYKDLSTTYLFLANNLQHIMVRVRASNLQYMFGEKWIAEHDSKIRQFVDNYERLAWGHVLETLPDHTTVVSSAHAMECLRKFNSGFERTYRKQRGCIVEDQKLREEIKGSLGAKLAKSYGEFYDAHKDSLEGHRNPALFVKSSPEDIRNYISDLFYGDADRSSKFRTSSLSLSSRPSRSR
ncbi:hypothetical protein MLD38_040751 [Melastoma candidum]|nr:hypothetical protein MLD38_040751 [Melastoma candidum]